MQCKEIYLDNPKIGRNNKYEKENFNVIKHNKIVYIRCISRGAFRGKKENVVLYSHRVEKMYKSEKRWGVVLYRIVPTGNFTEGCFLKKAFVIVKV